jgi:hypothetical protein
MVVATTAPIMLKPGMTGMSRATALPRSTCDTGKITIRLGRRRLWRRQKEEADPKELFVRS